MRARTGKIARLPEPIRHEINQLLHDGLSGKQIVSWLNQQPAVKQVMADRFAGQPISEHNVSEWRHGGYQDWLRDLETRARILHLTEQYEHTDSEGRLGRRAESMFIAELIDALDQLHKIKNEDVRSARLHRICRDLARLQNLHCRGLELRLSQEKSRHQPRRLEPSRTF